MKVRSVEASAPLLRKLPSGDKWEYAELWSCRIHLKGEGVLAVRIAPGYWTDLASVPKALRGAFDNGSGDFGVLIASQVHDMLYSTHYLSKDFSDELFRLLLRFYKMSAFKAWLYYEAVALFGASAWEASDLDLNADRALCALDWLAK
jgi:hypothetical protein